MAYFASESVAGTQLPVLYLFHARAKAMSPNTQITATTAAGTAVTQAGAAWRLTVVS